MWDDLGSLSLFACYSYYDHSNLGQTINIRDVANMPSYIPKVSKVFSTLAMIFLQQNMYLSQSIMQS